MQSIFSWHFHGIKNLPVKDFYQNFLSTYPRVTKNVTNEGSIFEHDQYFVIKVYGMLSIEYLQMKI